MYVILCCASLALAGWYFACYRHYKEKWEKLKIQYDARCENFTDALGEARKLEIRNNALAEDNKWLEERIREYKHLICSGCRNLKTHEWSVSVASQEPIAGISVIGQDTINPDLWFGVKDFLFNPNDPEDREFAIREAEELIETINKF